jgi:hypothetical protein
MSSFSQRIKLLRLLIHCVVPDCFTVVISSDRWMAGRAWEESGPGRCLFAVTRPPIWRRRGQGSSLFLCSATPNQKFPCNHHLSSQRVRAAAAHVVSCDRSENISWLSSQVCRLRIIWHPRVVSCTNQCMYILYSCNLHYMNSFVAGSFVQDRHFLKLWMKLCRCIIHNIIYVSDYFAFFWKFRNVTSDNGVLLQLVAIYSFLVHIRSFFRLRWWSCENGRASSARTVTSWSKDLIVIFITLCIKIIVTTLSG